MPVLNKPQPLKSIQKGTLHEISQLAPVPLMTTTPQSTLPIVGIGNDKEILIKLLNSTHL